MTWRAWYLRWWQRKEAIFALIPSRPFCNLLFTILQSAVYITWPFCRALTTAEALLENGKSRADIFQATNRDEPPGNIEIGGKKYCQHANNCWSKSTKVWCESSLAMQNCVNSILQKQYHMTWNSIRCYIWCIGQGLLCLYSPIISQFWWLDHFLAASLQLDTFILV